MDPVSALGIAAAVAQFIQFSGSLVSKSRQIYKQGSCLDFVECENATKRLGELTASVRGSMSTSNGLGMALLLDTDSQALDIICSDCLRLSKELQEALRAVQGKEGFKGKKWKSFRQALKSVSTKDKIDSIAKRLSDCQKELDSHLIVSIRNKVDRMTCQQAETIKLLNDKSKWTVEAWNQSQGAIISRLPKPYTVESQLLQSLQFPAMYDRHVEISEAHEKTFQWIFEKDSGAGVRWSNFVDWLENGSGAYWINGKAGSGKSTLMRYIFDHEETRRLLSAWAKDSTLDILAFFFWNSGSHFQASLEGLFRSFLHQALRQRHDLVRHVFPNEWASNSVRLSQSQPPQWNWTLVTLKAAFKRWIDTAGTSKIFLFVDGLDEYDEHSGHHEEIAEFFKSISTLPNIKICVSSRPWVVFDEAFKDLPRLRLQDLTLPDIVLFVNDKLRNHPRMRLLTAGEPEHAKTLVSEIVAKASGVFLWVKLVVKSLLSGLRNRDGINDLQKRLLELPSDLASLYRHMLNRIEPLYQQQGFHAFHLFRTMSLEFDPVLGLEFELGITATQDSSLGNDYSAMKVEEVKSRCDRLDVYLKTRCAGLLEIHGLIRPLTATVAYIHRTAKDFIESEKDQLFVKETTPNLDYKLPAMILCLIMLKRMVMNFHARPADEVVELVLRAMRFAKRIQISGRQSYVPVLDELQSISLRIPTIFNRQKFIEEAFCQGLDDYAQRETWRHPQLRHTLPQCNSVLSKLIHYQTHIDDVPLARFKEALRHESPNQLWYGNSPWQQVLTFVHRTDWRICLLRNRDDNRHAGCIYRSCTEEARRFEHWATIFRLFLEAGASTRTTCTSSHRMLFEGGRTDCHAVYDVIDNSFKHLALLEVRLDLLNLVDEMALREEKEQNKLPNTRKRSQELELSGTIKRTRR